MFRNQVKKFPKHQTLDNDGKSYLPTKKRERERRKSPRLSNPGKGFSRSNGDSSAMSV